VDALFASYKVFARDAASGNWACQASLFEVLTPHRWAGAVHVVEFLDKKAGAGALLDMGVYAFTWVDLAMAGS